MKKINRSFMINDELFLKLKIYAASKNIPISHIIEYIIARFLKVPYHINSTSIEQMIRELN
jgi:hypothetical protein